MSLSSKPAGAVSTLAANALAFSHGKVLSCHPAQQSSHGTRGTRPLGQGPGNRGPRRREGERPPRNRLERWGRAVLEAGKDPLTLDEIIRLQRVLIFTGA
jgi:hypothetical protein